MTVSLPAVVERCLLKIELLTQQLTGSAHMSIQAVRGENASSLVLVHVDVASGTSTCIRCHSKVARGRAKQTGIVCGQRPGARYEMLIPAPVLARCCLQSSV